MTEGAYLETLGEWMRNERVALGMKQQEVARAIGVSDSAISSWEEGRTAMSVVSHQKLRIFFKNRRAAMPRSNWIKVRDESEATN